MEAALKVEAGLYDDDGLTVVATLVVDAGLNDDDGLTSLVVEAILVDGKEYAKAIVKKNYIKRTPDYANFVFLPINAIKIKNFKFIFLFFLKII